MRVNQNKAIAMNVLNSWINKVVPELTRELLAGYRIKADYTLYKADKLRFDEILSTAPFRAHLTFSEHSVWLKTDITYKTSDTACAYYKRNIFLQDPTNNDIVSQVNFKTNYTEQFLLNLEQQLKEFEKQKSEIESNIFQIKIELQ